MRLPSIVASFASAISSDAISRGSRCPQASRWRTAALLIGGLSAGIVGISAYAALKLTRPTRSYGNGEQPDGTFEPVEFLSTDGLRLSGWFLPAPEARDAIVLCHGFKTGRREMLPLALGLRQRGHHVLLFDFRGHGQSDGQWSSCGWLETRDLEGAVRHLQQRRELEGCPVGVIGFSMGGAVALLAASQMPEIAAVVSDSSFATLQEAIATGFCALLRLPRYPFASLALWFGERLVGMKAEQVRPLDAIPDLSPRPLLLIHGTEDRVVPLSEAYLLYEAAGEPKELWVVAGAGHVEARQRDLLGYLDRVDRFFRRHLAPIGEPAALRPRSPGSSRS